MENTSHLRRVSASSRDRVGAVMAAAINWREGKWNACEIYVRNLRALFIHHDPPHPFLLDIATRPVCMLFVIQAYNNCYASSAPGFRILEAGRGLPSARRRRAVNTKKAARERPR